MAPTGNEGLAGVTEIVSSVGPEGLRITRVVVVLCVRAPLVPVIVSVNDPVGVVGVVVIVNVEGPDPTTSEGLNVPVAPAGSPLTDRLTDPLNAFIPVTVAE